MNTEKETSNFEIVESNAIEAMERAQIDIQIATAKRYPRDLSSVKKSMLSFATLDQETAEACFYTLPRGGKVIQGPSVRLAEIAISCFGNLRVGTRVISVDAGNKNPHVVVQSVAHDLQNNVAVQIEKRRRITKKKSKDSIDEDDINLAVNAASAIALRDATFKVVPLALVKPVFLEAKRVAIGDAKSLLQRREKALETFAKMGVSTERVLLMLEKSGVESIDLNDLEKLLGLHNAIRDGDTSIDDAFPQNKPAPAKPKGEQPKDENAPVPEASTPATEQPQEPDKEPFEILEDALEKNQIDHLIFENFLKRKKLLSSASTLTKTTPRLGNIVHNLEVLVTEFKNEQEEASRS